MCLIIFAYDVHPHYRLVLAANRDEFYDRPAAPLHFWEDHPHILAGRDLRQMGTWLGMTRSGRLAAITNYRDPGRINPAAPSRGDLVGDFLKGDGDPVDYIREVDKKSGAYNGFNLIVGDGNGLHYASNQGGGFRSLEPGIYGLSNHLLNTRWPKVNAGTAWMRKIVAAGRVSLLPELTALLCDREQPPDDQLPDTGVGLTWERLLAPIFISSRTYGTRCSSIVAISRTDQVAFTEISWEPDRKTPRSVQRSGYTFSLV